MIGVKNLSQGDTEHLSALVKSGLDDTTEELFIAPKVGDSIARHTDNGALHFWRRIENRRLNHEEIFHIIPGLNQNGEDAILLIAWL